MRQMSLESTETTPAKRWRRVGEKTGSIDMKEVEV